MRSGQNITSMVEFPCPIYSHILKHLAQRLPERAKYAFLEARIGWDENGQFQLPDPSPKPLMLLPWLTTVPTPSVSPVPSPLATRRTSQGRGTVGFKRRQRVFCKHSARKVPPTARIKPPAAPPNISFVLVHEFSYLRVKAGRHHCCLV